MYGKINSRIIAPAYTFDDLLILPGESKYLPHQIDIKTHLTEKLLINIPVISSAMDTVTEEETSIALARAGGIGIVHRNLTILRQCEIISMVKSSESGMITRPKIVTAETKISEVLKLMKKYQISGFPVVDGRKLIGIITNRDLAFGVDEEQLVKDVMTSERLIIAPPGTTLEKSKGILHKHRIEKLLIVDAEGNLVGLITKKDIEKIIKYPNSCKDSLGRLRVGAAIGVTGDYLERTAELVNQEVDVVVIDTAHGHSSRVKEATKIIKARYPDLQLIVGNVATETVSDFTTHFCFI